MAHQTLKIQPGVDTNLTPVLNVAAISSSNLVRFMPDPSGLGLVQKLGGWMRYYSSSVASVIRALWAYQDTNNNKILGVGQENGLYAIVGQSPNGNRLNITQQTSLIDVSLSASSAAGSSLITITDASSDVFNFDSVDIQTPIAVGGITLFGLYPVYANISANSYQVQATTVLGFPNPAFWTSTATQYQVLGTYTASASAGTATLTFTGPVTFPVSSNISVMGCSLSTLNGNWTVTASTSTTVSFASTATGTGSATQGAILGGPTLPLINTISGSSTVTIYFPNHGYSVGNSFAVLTPTTVGGVTISGNYIIQSVIDQNTFTINSLATVTSTAQSFINGGTAQYNYYIGQGQTTAASGYGVPNYGIGGYGSGVALPGGRTFTTTAASGTGSVATLSFSGNYYIQPGSTFSVSGLTPSGYNTTQATVLSCLPGATTTISYASAATGAQTVAGTITMLSYSVYPVVGTYTTTSLTGTGPTANPTATATFSGNVYIPTGYWVTVSGAVPAGYNGTYQISSSSYSAGTTTITFPNSTTGTQTVAGTVTIFAKTTDWSIDNWGDILIASPQNGAIYQWYYQIGQPFATVIPQAPTVNTGCFVAMPQRQIIAYGSTFNGIQDPLLIRWCDVSNNGTWIAQSTNQAGSYRIPRGSKIVGGLQATQQGLIWTDLALWAMQYVGQPYIYSFNQIGDGCGLIAKKAAVSISNNVYWMGQSQFFSLTANGVAPLECPIWDVVFQNLDTANLDKIRCGANSRFGEVTWFYPVAGGNGENSAYVKYNILLNKWDYGNLARTAWIDNSVLGPPIGAGWPLGTNTGSQYIYQHETSNDADGSALTSSFQTGWFSLSEGDVKTFVDEIWPDFKWGTYSGSQSANIQLTFYGADFPGQTPTVYGPYNVTNSTQWFNPRIRNRLFAFQISSSDVGSFWRIGGLRYRAQPDGRY